MKSKKLTKRIFLFSIAGMLLSTNMSIGANMLLEEYELTTAMLGRGGLWLDTSIFRISILGFLALVSGLKLLDYRYMRNDR